jgi:hypothetical protein
VFAVNSATQRSRALSDKLTVAHLVKKFYLFYGNQKRITVFTGLCPAPDEFRSCVTFSNLWFLSYGEVLLGPDQLPSWRTTSGRLSVRSYLPLLEAVSWGRHAVVTHN